MVFSQLCSSVTRMPEGRKSLATLIMLIDWRLRTLKCTLVARKSFCPSHQISGCFYQNSIKVYTDSLSVVLGCTEYRFNSVKFSLHENFAEILKNYFKFFYKGVMTSDQMFTVKKILSKYIMCMQLMSSYLCYVCYLVKVTNDKHYLIRVICVLSKYK